MNFIPEALETYCITHSEKIPPILEALERETWQKVLAPRMLTGGLQGRLLSALATLKAPKQVLEIGTYTGYSALCLAEGLTANGTLHTIDKNEELVALQHKYFSKSPFGNQIKTYLGDALEVLPTLNVMFDLVFLDADKKNYPNYLKLIIPKLNPGAILLSDNVLWSGKVINPLEKNDEDTQALLTYNKLLANHPQFKTVLMPIRDGLTLSVFKP